MVTGPMPRNPNATNPKAKTAGATMSVPSPGRAHAISGCHQRRIAMSKPIRAHVARHKTGKNVQRRASLREEATTSRTWRDSMDVNTLTSSGITAPASVPQVITLDSFHQSEVSPPRSGIIA